MKQIHLLGLALALAIGTQAQAQYHQRDRDDYYRHDRVYYDYDQDNHKDTRLDWGFKEEQWFLKRLDLSSDQWRDVHRLLGQTHNDLEAALRDRDRKNRESRMVDSLRHYHSDLRHILTDRQYQAYVSFWQNELSRHRDWWTLQFDTEKNIAWHLDLSRDQRDDLGRLNDRTSHQVNDALEDLREDSRNRVDFGEGNRRLHDLLRDYHTDLFRILGNDQQRRFTQEYRQESKALSDADRLRRIWLQTL